YMSEGSAIEQIWFQFAIMRCCFFIGFLSPCIYRRFGRGGLYIFYIVLIAAVTIGMFLIGYYGQRAALFETLGSMSAAALAGWAFAPAALLAVGSYAMLRRSTN